MFGLPKTVSQSKHTDNILRLNEILSQHNIPNTFLRTAGGHHTVKTWDKLGNVRMAQVTPFRDAPAAMFNHHNYTGGLVEHTLQMIDWWLTLKDHLLYKTIIAGDVFSATPEEIEANPDLGADNSQSHCNALSMERANVTDRNVILGILLHDFHKGFCFELNMNYDENKPHSRDNTQYRYVESVLHQTTTCVQQSLYFWQQMGMPMDAVLMSTFAHNEGGWSEFKAKNNTVLGKICYLLDELSGNVEGRFESPFMRQSNFSQEGGFNAPDYSFKFAEPAQY